MAAYSKKYNYVSKVPLIKAIWQIVFTESCSLTLKAIGQILS